MKVATASGGFAYREPMEFVRRRLGRFGASTAAIFVVGDGPRVGKSTVAALLAQRLGLAASSTSSVIASVYEKEHGLPAGEIARARIGDPNAYREELREVGDRMGSTDMPAGLAALIAGARIVDGIRRAGELDVAVRGARRRGLTPLVVFVTRSTNASQDNTQAEALRRAASVEVDNSAESADLPSRVDDLVTDLRLTDLTDGALRRRLSRFVQASHTIEDLDPAAFGPHSPPFLRHLSLAERTFKGPPISPTELHLRLMHGLLSPEDVGRYRHHSVLVGGQMPPSPGGHLERHMTAWSALRLAGPIERESPADFAWRVHDEFECVHPFADGNGRVGRLLLNGIRRDFGLPWLTILPRDRPWYYRRIRSYRQRHFVCFEQGGQES